MAGLGSGQRHGLQIGKRKPGLGIARVQLEGMAERLGCLVDAPQCLQRIAKHDARRHMAGRQLQGALKRRQRVLGLGAGLEGLAEIEPGGSQIRIERCGPTEHLDGRVNLAAGAQRTAEIVEDEDIIGCSGQGSPKNLHGFRIVFLQMLEDTLQAQDLRVRGSDGAGRNQAAARIVQATRLDSRRRLFRHLDHARREAGQALAPFDLADSGNICHRLIQALQKVGVRWRIAGNAATPTRIPTPDDARTARRNETRPTPLNQSRRQTVGEPRRWSPSCPRQNESRRNRGIHRHRGGCVRLHCHW